MQLANKKKRKKRKKRKKNKLVGCGACCPLGPGYLFF